jgi:hypothetical protein
MAPAVTRGAARLIPAMTQQLFLAMLLIVLTACANAAHRDDFPPDRAGKKKAKPRKG